MRRRAPLWRGEDKNDAAPMTPQFQRSVAQTPAVPPCQTLRHQRKLSCRHWWCSYIPSPALDFVNSFRVTVTTGCKPDTTEPDCAIASINDHNYYHRHANQCTACGLLCTVLSVTAGSASGEQAQLQGEQAQLQGEQAQLQGSRISFRESRLSFRESRLSFRESRLSFRGAGSASGRAGSASGRAGSASGRLFECRDVTPAPFSPGVCGIGRLC